MTDIEKIDAVYKRHFHYDWDEEDRYTFEPFIMACQFGQLQHVKRYIETEKVKHTCEKTRGHLLMFDSINDEEGELREDMDNINRCEGIIYLGCEFWSEKNQKILENYIDDKHMKILVGNPDIIAPQQTSFSKLSQIKKVQTNLFW